MPHAEPSAGDARSAAHEIASGGTEGTAHHPRQVVSVRTLVAAGLIVLAVVGVVFLLIPILGIVLVVLMAIVFAEGIRPIVNWLRVRRVPAPLGIIIVYVGLLAFLGLLVLILVQPIVGEAKSLANDFPTYQKNFLSFFNSVESQFHFSVNISQQVGQALGAAQQVLFTIGSTIFGIAVDFVLVLVIGFMWLLSSDRLKRFVVDLMPLSQQELATDVFREIGFRMGGFVRAVAINSVVIGIATGVACWILGLPSPILLGIFAAITGAVPIIGPFIGVVPPVLIGFTISPAYPVLVLVVLLVIQLIDANTVVPLVMNRVVALPALAVVLALLIGGTLQGLIGALLAVPIAAAIQVVTLRVLVPAVHRSQGRAGPVTARQSPAAPAGAAGTGRRLLPRLRRS